MPESTVQVDTPVHIKVEQSGGAVGNAIAVLVAEHTLALILGHLSGPDRNGRAVQHVRQFVLGRFAEFLLLLSVLLEAGVPRPATATVAAADASALADLLTALPADESCWCLPVVVPPCCCSDVDKTLDAR